MAKKRPKIAAAPAAVAEPEGAAPAPSRAPLRVLGLPLWVAIGLGVSLVLLLAHARVYDFLTDDAYISFRYARNFARGYGLVFNPGYERVEGYTNFLWVLILAGISKLGVAPETAAGPLGYLMTVVLWGVVVGFALRAPRTPGREWVALVPAFGLALTRSVAVWSTSGLETRLFELLTVAGLLRLVVEVEALILGRERRAIAAWLLALGTLTRPDGLLLAAGAFGLTGLALVLLRRDLLVPYVRRLIPFAVLVAAHFVFRRIYYGYWLPNTYYAKFGGHYWWSSGFRYLASFTIEYFAVLWIPLVVAGVRFRLARATPMFPIVAATLIPHLAYVAAVGGDHFEYRLLDVVFPFAFLLMADGANGFATSRLRTAVAAAYLGLVALGLWIIPWESHRQFVREYMPGFPGMKVHETQAAEGFLSPDSSAVLRLPGFRQAATAHRDLTRWLTSHFVAIRAEEHRMFLATAIREGRALARVRNAGYLPRDTYIAIDCVGAIPYYSELRTLDRLGLTDTHVAHSPLLREVMAHGKSATREYAHERGVDLWAVDAVHFLLSLTSTRLIMAVHDGFALRQPYYAVDAGTEGYMMTELPMGLEATRARLPRLRIISLQDSTFVRDFLDRAKAAYLDTLTLHPDNLRAARNLGYVLLMRKDFVEARRLYVTMCTFYPNLVEGFEHLSLCDLMLGRETEGLHSAEMALTLATAQDDTAAVARVRTRINEAIEAGNAKARGDTATIRLIEARLADAIRAGEAERRAAPLPFAPNR